MKILLVMDPGILVPPNGYGGIERVVAMLAEQYQQSGHEVHLFVTTGSYVDGCTMHAFGREGFPPKKKDALKAIPVAWKFLWQHRNDFDLVHSFGRLAYLLPILNHPAKKIMSYQREISHRNIRWINKLPQQQMYFTGCSHDLVKRGAVAGNWRGIHNPVKFDYYQPTAQVPADAPLMFLGRIERVKGCHTAIKVAKQTNHQLIIAGNISNLPDEAAYYKNEIEPLIDGDQIKFIGPVNDAQKNEWLGKSKAMLFPIEWNEPFGIVMAEAMACGTPVVAFTHGSVNEVIEDGVTGYKTNNIEEMCAAVLQLSSFDRRRCRQEARKKFDIAVIANQYLSI